MLCKEISLPAREEPDPDNVAVLSVDSRGRFTGKNSTAHVLGRGSSRATRQACCKRIVKPFVKNDWLVPVAKNLVGLAEDSSYRPLST